MDILIWCARNKYSKGKLERLPELYTDVQIGLSSSCSHMQVLNGCLGYSYKVKVFQYLGLLESVHFKGTLSREATLPVSFLHHFSMGINPLRKRFAPLRNCFN